MPDVPSSATTRAPRRPRRIGVALAGAALATAGVITGVVTATASDAAPAAPATPFAAPSLGSPVSTRFDIEGHRGTRGERPEETIPAFQRALDIGVKTLELDTAISKDGVVIVSHDSFINPVVCRDTAPVSSDDAAYPYVGDLIKNLTYAQLQTLDCGTRTPTDPATDPFYATQVPVPGAKLPTLDQVFALVEQRGADDVQLNIETKLDPTAPGDTVSPAVFVAKDLAVIRAHRNGVARSLLQSFDWRTLAIARQQEPALRRVALVDASTAQVGQAGRSPWLGGIDVDASPYKGDVPYAATSVGASVVSPDQSLVTAAFVSSAHRHRELVVPYTVNAVRDMQKEITLGVDGIITDYPDRLRDVLAVNGFRLPKAYPAR